MPGTIIISVVGKSASYEYTTEEEGPALKRGYVNSGPRMNILQPAAEVTRCRTLRNRRAGGRFYRGPTQISSMDGVNAEARP